MGNANVKTFAFLETLSKFCCIVGGSSSGHVKIYPDMISPIHLEQIVAHCNKFIIIILINLIFLKLFIN